MKKSQRKKLEQLARKYEHYETDLWAAPAVLQREILTRHVVDLGCGTGILSEALKEAGYKVTSIDIHDWGYPGTIVMDILDPANRKKLKKLIQNKTVFMNPPFSLAVDFIRIARQNNARKIVSFQRYAWRESIDRKKFWQDFPANRIYLCGSRAQCWRHDIPKKKRKSSSPTAHAFFVWERWQPAGTLEDIIYKP